jgi:hypothetical protein
MTVLGGAVEIWETMKRRQLKMVPPKEEIEIVNMKRIGSTKVAKTKPEAEDRVVQRRVVQLKYAIGKPLSKHVTGVHLHEGQLVVVQAPD